METIGERKFFTFLDDADNAKASTNTNVRKNKPHRVSSYLELASKVAELQFLNRDSVLLFRGQGKDFPNQRGNSSLKPSLFRPTLDGKLPKVEELARRYSVLSSAEHMLVSEYQLEKLPGLDRIRRQQILRWAILQHYEVCPTPLLDVTHSLRIAASFASSSEHDKGILFVLGVPNISGAVTASAEAGVQVVRLASVCPPAAMRPHLQEGYLLGEYPELRSIEQKQQYEHYEIDFGKRLIAKFAFDPKALWSERAFKKADRDALYPSSATDPLLRLTTQIREQLPTAN